MTAQLQCVVGLQLDDEGFALRMRTRNETSPPADRLVCRWAGSAQQAERGHGLALLGELGHGGVDPGAGEGVDLEALDDDVAERLLYQKTANGYFCEGRRTATYWSHHAREEAQ